jgi:putative endonuclease
MFTTYAIQSTIRNYIYVGMTDNLERRLDEHNRGKNRSTKAYTPFILIYTKIFETRLEAREHEKMLKS